MLQFRNKKSDSVMVNYTRLIMNKCSKMSLFVFSLFIAAITFAGTKGDEIFNKMCMTCHSTTDKILVGPGLGGVADRRSEEWILKWVKDPQGMIAAGDKDAVKLFEEFNKVPMPGFAQLSDDDIKEVLAYIKEKEASVVSAAPPGGETASTTSSVTSTSEVPTDSNGMLWFWLVIAGFIVIYLLYRFRKKTFDAMNTNGYHELPHKYPNFSGVFILYLCIAGLVIALMTYFLKQKYETMASLMFVGLPYISIGIFLVGSIYRYKKTGFYVSSLSSQFLEGKKLFWGSQPFHWGMLVLFIGHLTAFMFPKFILAWNGQPVRLLILEISSFTFALSAFFGLIMLIKRRLSTKMVLVVTNKMDMLVYTILIVQIVSGLAVALFVRWGSSWFSSVLTPYLRSVFTFTPDTSAVAELPLLIQLHIISAFAIIAIIPFTRFVHFLVAPFDYIWRKYQVVIWNWNRAAIRTSTRHFFGKRPKNH